MRVTDLLQLLENYKNKKIALYGLGTESEKALVKLDGAYEIIGLLDSFREEGELYGKQIISLSDAIGRGVKLIVVVARPGSCKAIAKKIGDICRENQIALIDIRGKDLLVTKQISYDFSHIVGVTKEELREKIHQAEVVSFDLFDTLVMRQTLYSDDVFQYVDCILQEKGIKIKDFCKRRLASEKELSKNSAPTLTEIYEDLLAKLDDGFEKASLMAEELADLEWSIDFKLLIPRKEVCDFFRETVRDGKSVYVVSDTYYNKAQLVQILDKCDITEYVDILASSDYKTSKTQNLYSILRGKEKGKKCFHIGDDVVADIESTDIWGIEACQIYSGLELLDMAGNLGLTNDADSLSDHLRIGMFVSKIFNSPFQFEKEERRIEVSDAYDIGYLFCAPMISDFVFWFYRQVKEQNIKNIWFCARDGYLMKKLYTHLLESYEQEDKSTYFLTSRIAAIRAGVQSEKDIQYVDEMKFSGTLEECLRERFGIEADAIDKEDICNGKAGLLKYKNTILDNSKVARKNYQRYIENLGISEGDIAFFDFVAKGTSQLYMQRVVSNHLKGLYFLQLEAENMKDKGLDIQPFYSNKETDTSAIFDNYYILETLLTAPHPSVSGFDEKGNPIFTEETRTEKDINCFLRAQEGILDYFKTYLSLCQKAEWRENKSLDEMFLKLLHGITIIDRDFLDLVVEDPFFNRMTNITDVL